MAKSAGHSVELVHVINSDGQWNSTIPKRVRFRIRLNNYLTKVIRFIIQDNEISPAFIRTGFGRHINALDCDLVHLHWVAGGLMSASDLSDIHKDIVVSVHDTWILNGLYNTKLVPSKRILRIFSKQFIARLNRLGVTFCVTTKWIAQKLDSIDIFAESKVSLVQIPLDNVYTPSLLPVENKTKLFKVGLGAVNVETDLNKGYEFVLRALSSLPPKVQSSIELHLFGSKEYGCDSKHLFKIVKHGYIKSPQVLRNFYRAMDLQLLPSSMEMFGQVACEALQCGTPILISDRCGFSDHIRMGFNGQIYRCGDLIDFNAAFMKLVNRHSACPQEISLSIYEDFDTKKLANQLTRCYVKT